MKTLFPILTKNINYLRIANVQGLCEKNIFFLKIIKESLNKIDIA